MQDVYLAAIGGIWRRLTVGGRCFRRNPEELVSRSGGVGRSSDGDGLHAADAAGPIPPFTDAAWQRCHLHCLPLADGHA